MSTTIDKTVTNPQASTPPRHRAVTLRSVLLGLLGVLFICGLTSYNDFVVANTFLVGNFLPIGLLLFFLVFVLLINGPLHRFFPRLSLSRGELGVALCMMLVSSAMPSSGLMRYLPAHLVGLWNKAGINADYANVMEQADLPDWLFPKFERQGTQGRANDPVVQQYLQRVPDVPNTFSAHFWAVPWGKWAVPAVTWGIFVMLLVGAMLCLSVVFRRQWVENERLPYPLAGVYLSVIEEPRPGHMLNALFSSVWFWIAAGVVFAIHGANALNKYDPKIFPQIPIQFDLGGIFGNPPLSFTDWGFKSATLYFSMVGIVYFLQSNVAFSLWFSFILVQFVKMFYGSSNTEFTGGMQQDQNFGACVMFCATILFIGRHQLVTIAKQMFASPKEGEPRGRYLPYFIAGWGLVLCAAGMVAWLMVAGVTLAGAVMTIGMAGMLYLVIARVVAETGLMFVQLSASVARPWAMLAQSLPEGLAAKTTVKSFFFSAWFQGMFVHDQRESLSGFLPQALRVADGAAYEDEKSWKKVLPFTLCLLLAMGVGYLIAGGSMLYTEYNYGTTLSRQPSSPLNGYGVDGSVQGQVLDPTRDYITKGGPSDNHNRWLHTGIGAAITGFLGIMRLRFASWPLHPVGYLLCFSYPMQKIWWSIFVGWAAKVVIVKYGGSTMYRNVKPLFMGLIIGEVGAAAFWLVVSLVLNMLGMQYNAINLLPS